MAAFIPSIISSVFGILDKVVPDPKQAADMKLKIMELNQNGQLEALKLNMSAIVAEANSQDKWTSRARPSFLYVIYMMILASIPMGIMFAINPSIAGNIAIGMKQWLGAIPTELYNLFGIGYLGYSGARSFEKHSDNKVIIAKVNNQ